MINLLAHLSDVAKGKTTLGTKRSSKWPTVRKQHLSEKPTCAVCGGVDKLEVHHIRPFHIHPELELDLTNLITLCESDKGGINCHLFTGHLGNFKSFNVSVTVDAADWNSKIKNRPMGEPE